MISDEEFKKEVIEKLDVLVKLVAVSTHAETLLAGKRQKDQIKILADLGLSRNIIALVVGTTPEIVSVRLSQMKSKTKSDKKSTVASMEGNAEK
jgi:CRP-like cAMP-binding protein